MFKAWNVMGGEIQWSALDTIAEMLGIDDVEQFIAELVALRTYQNEKEDD